MSDSELLIAQSPEGVLELTFNRPEKMNSLSPEVLAAFEGEIARAEIDDAVRVVVLKGAGDKAFIAGADIGEYRGRRRAAFNAYQLNSRRLFDRLERLPKPTIAAIHGFALGGGFELALCCDVILATHSARFGLPEGTLGLSPGGGGTQRLTRAVGKYEASNVMLGGWRLTGARAHALGIVAELCADDELDELVKQRAKAMLKIAPLAQAAMKQLIREGADAPIDVAKSFEQQVLFDLYMSDDAEEGIEAFFEKRAPNFKGR